MELVKLKMKPIYKIALFLVFILLSFLVFIGVKYLVTGKIGNKSSDIEVVGNLSINYLSGKSFSASDEKKYKVSITNDGKGTANYVLGFTNIKGTGSYNITSNEEVLFEGEFNKSKQIYTESVTIDEGETKIYEISIKSSSTDKLTGNFSVQIKDDSTSFGDIIIANNKVKESPVTKAGEEAAKENEGLIKDTDDLGTTYYFRGNVDNNYMSFGDFLWRIVRINGDGTVRIILDEGTETVSNYYGENKEYDFSESKMHSYLVDWLSINLSDLEDYIANTKYCNDMVHDDEYHFNALTRIQTNKIPSFNCLGTSYTDNIGLITVDEVVFAGASPSGNNDSYYLYNKDISEPWYTMTAAKGDKDSLNMFMVDQKGALNTSISADLFRAVRPVINIKKDVNIDGTGTKSDPYIIVVEN